MGQVFDLDRIFSFFFHIEGGSQPKPSFWPLSQKWQSCPKIFILISEVFLPFLISIQYTIRSGSSATVPVSVLARVQEKLTGRDQIAYRIGAKKILTGTTAGSDQSTSGGSAGGDAGGGSHQGQDQDVEDGDSSSNNEGMSSTLLEEPMAIAEQVDKLIIEAQSHENLSQLFIGWCPFW